MFSLGTIACNKHGLSHKAKSGATLTGGTNMAITGKTELRLCCVQPVPQASSMLVGKAKLAMMFGIKVATCNTADCLEVLLPYELKSTRHAVAKLHLVAQPDFMCIVSRVCLQAQQSTIW